MIRTGATPTTLIDRNVDASGNVSNPSDNTNLEDTGALSEGAWWFGIYIKADTATEVTVEHRNAANSANIYAFDIPIAADTPTFLPFPIEVEVAASERLRVLQDGALTGNIEVVIWSGKAAS